MKRRRQHRQLPEPPRPSSQRKETPLYLLLAVALFAFALLIDLHDTSPAGALVYRDAGYGYGYGGGFFGGFGFFQFGDLYHTYGYIIDAALFLLIFLGVGKGVFKKHFGEGGTPVYTGIGFFLAFALLLWEENHGVYLLEQFGPFVVVLFLAVFMLWALRWIQQSGFGWLPTLSGAYLFFWLFLTAWKESYIGRKLLFLLDQIHFPFDWDFLGFFAALSVVGIAVSFILAWQRRKKPSPSPSRL